MQPKCRVCGRFISEHDLWDCDSMECCEEHGFIKICGECIEYFEKSERFGCVIEIVRPIRRKLTEDDYPQYACPNCDYQSHSFNAAANHMMMNNHLYQGVGTYPIFIQGPETDPRKLQSLSRSTKK